MSKDQVIPERAKKIYMGLKDKSFGIKDIKKFDESNVRQLRYWITLGLLGDSTNDAVGRDKFNFYEFVWVLIIKELKELNFDNSIIQKCAVDIFTRMDKNDQMLEFEKAILYTLVNRKDSFFVISKSGEFDVHRPEDFTKIAAKNRFETCVIMNILPLVKGFLYMGDFADYISERELLRENEIRAIQLLHTSKTASVNIELSNRVITIQPGNEAVIEFVNAIFTHEYKTISIQFLTIDE